MQGHLVPESSLPVYIIGTDHQDGGRLFDCRHLAVGSAEDYSSTLLKCDLAKRVGRGQSLITR